MRKLTFMVGALLFLVFPANAFGEGPLGASADVTTPALEIKEYRFQRHPRHGYDRLVLEFYRRDSNSSAEPTVQVSRESATTSTITIQNAVLVGAIPESLINDSFVGKSKYLGPISVNMETTGDSFSLRGELKTSSATLKAFWLANPSRLVIDGISKNRDIAISREGRHSSPKNDYICFPANAAVGLSVVFQPRDHYREEIQNVRVNLEGNAVTPQATLPEDAILCYPKRAEVNAKLNFEFRASPMSFLGSSATVPAQTKAAQTPGASKSGFFGGEGRTPAQGATDGGDLFGGGGAEAQGNQNPGLVPSALLPR